MSCEVRRTQLVAPADAANPTKLHQEQVSVLVHYAEAALLGRAHLQDGQCGASALGPGLYSVSHRGVWWSRGCDGAGGPLILRWNLCHLFRTLYACLILFRNCAINLINRIKFLCIRNSKLSSDIMQYSIHLIWLIFGAQNNRFKFS